MYSAECDIFGSLFFNQILPHVPQAPEVLYFFSKTFMYSMRGRSSACKQVVGGVTNTLAQTIAIHRHQYRRCQQGRQPIQRCAFLSKRLTTNQKLRRTCYTYMCYHVSTPRGIFWQVHTVQGSSETVSSAPLSLSYSQAPHTSAGFAALLRAICLVTGCWGQVCAHEARTLGSASTLVH